MAKHKIQEIDDDFINVVSLFQDRKLMPDPVPQNMNLHAKSIHNSTYSLMIWRHRFRKLPDCGRVYLDEIASDALQILPQILLGFDKTVRLLCRGIIENTLRHVYFSDHPIEFQRTNREKWFLSFEELWQYAKIHPSYVETEKNYNALDQMKSLYSELSASVHGGAVRDLEMRVALKKITYSDTSAKKHADFVRLSSQLANFVLAIFHCQRVSKLAAIDKSIILRGMEKPARQIWVAYKAA